METQETQETRRSLRTVCVVGLGYIGLPTAVFFANAGYHVLGCDTNPDVVEAVKESRSPFFEPKFQELLETSVQDGNLSVATRPRPSDAFVISVPTPVKDDHDVDLSYISAATKSIANILEPGNLVVLESTSPPGTTQKVKELVDSVREDLSEEDKNKILYSHCPERVLPGNIVDEMGTNPRVVGGLTDNATSLAAELYSAITASEIFRTNAQTAELTKLAENAYRDVNIAFANELSLISDDLGVDVWELVELANKHPRVNILNPGPGVGGHCIAVDPWFIVSASPKSSNLIKTARQINGSMPRTVLKRAKLLLEGKIPDRISFLGGSFKANVSDTRESPSVEVIKIFSETYPEADLLLVDPHLENIPDSLRKVKNLRMGGLDACFDADLTLCLVDHEEFRSLDPSKGRAIVLDTRGLWKGAK